jgi:hypothetical protein
MNKKEDIMKFRIAAIFFIAIVSLSGVSNAAQVENYIQVKGEASIVVKPDIAHCFLIVTGYGKNYEASTKAANEKLGQLKSLLKTTLKESPEMTVLKIDNKPRGEGYDRKQYFSEMAKAIKGEAPGKEAEEQKEVGTHITVYFVLTNFNRESILTLINTLAEKEIAFNKSSRFEFDFYTEINIGQSGFYFGILNSDKQLAILSAEAYRKAEHDAQIIAAAIKKKLVGVVSITGCGDILEGNASMSEKWNLTGKVLGPLSSDPTRLLIRFSKDFGFKIE